tara:strand:+ start:4123 stop:4437 length:315 start_codon:yes stop_codon:yes gene_type:complete
VIGKQNRPIVSDKKYLKYLRGERCLFTGLRGTASESVVPMHIGTAGRGIKTDDEAVPALHSVHSEGHQNGEISMIREMLPDNVLREAVRALAREMYLDYKDQAS